MLGADRQRALLQPLAGEEPIDPQIGQGPAGAELLILGADGLAELEIDGEVAVELSFDE